MIIAPLGLTQLEYRAWPRMQSVETQFELRNVLSLSVNPPRSVIGFLPPLLKRKISCNLMSGILCCICLHSPDYWMASPPHDENELEPDTVSASVHIYLVVSPKILVQGLRKICLM